MGTAPKCVNGHDLTTENTAEGGGCRICRRDRSRQTQQRKDARRLAELAARRAMLDAGRIPPPRLPPRKPAKADAKTPTPRPQKPASTVTAKVICQTDPRHGATADATRFTEFRNLEAARAVAQQPCTTPGCFGTHLLVWRTGDDDKLNVALFGLPPRPPLAEELETLYRREWPGDAMALPAPLELNEPLIGPGSGRA